MIDSGLEIDSAPYKFAIRIISFLLLSSEAQLEAGDSHREGGILRLIINSVLITLPKNPLTDKNCILTERYILCFKLIRK